ncbi:DUF1573 domain-containing protein [Fulvivirga sedimenti]|jgi:hypothetical protein|uniref:DUF1573 domain-containing protein n=1 Tax=Fulvivirga sedimenti TaxID=2879465 RepID=A0A9X1L2Y4_9BACT|nr:DUF1573 domain-containing protein [Fulvivirga sedimenti]MCA6078661.1 DUF1573 domain-containing protein [Fulvivirga sedimenti]
MKKFATFFLMTGMAALLTFSCGNRDAEKRIAELESRLAELENGGTQVAPAVQANAPDQKPEGPLPTFAFNEIEHDFGTISEGDVVEHIFRFTNNGEAPLVIENAIGSCGCTVPTYTREPIPVGGEGEIFVKFDSKGKPNLQNKTVTITANTWPKKTMLRIKAMVNPAAATIQ